MRAYEAGLRVSYLDAPLVLKRYHGKNLAFDLEITEEQAIPRLDRFMRASAAVRNLYGPFDRSRLLTVRYVRAVHQMRRNGRWDKLTCYLKACVGPDRIREEVYRFVSAVAWYHVDRARFVREVAAYASDHPLWLFVQGFAELERGNPARAAEMFERAFVKPMRRFHEAMNSWALATWPVDRDRALALMEQLVEWNPDYRDARLNLTYFKQGQTAQCRHTICLRPYTLHWLSEWP
jgi:hypothetical protein